MLAISLAIICSCIGAREPGPPAEWFALKRELTLNDLNGLHATFTPVLSGDYSIALSFRVPLQDIEVRDLVNRSASGIGMDDPVRFDFDWRIVQDEKLVASGTGRHGAIESLTQAPKGSVRALSRAARSRSASSPRRPIAFTSSSCRLDRNLPPSYGRIRSLRSGLNRCRGSNSKRLRVNAELVSS